MSRAALYLKKNDFSSAVQDCSAVLDEQAPHIQNGFHDYYRFMKSYCLAKLHDPGFEDEAAKIPTRYTA